METPSIRTDFIPRQTSIKTPYGRGSRNNYFFLVSVIFFIVVLLVWGGLMVYEYILKKDNTSLEESLKKHASENVDTELANELEAFDNKLKTAETLLNNHMNTSLLFNLLEQDTLTTSVRYVDFSYSIEDGSVVVSLSGEAKSFASLGYQKKVLEDNPKIINPQFTSFTIDQEKGFILFNLSYSVDKSVTSFGENI